jgi:stage II sporulation SpoAA-like protein
MVKRVTDVPPQIDALAAIGTLTKEDYEQSIEPLFDDARRSGRRIQLLVEIGPDFDGYTAGAAWEKTANAEEDSRPLQRGPAAPVRAQAGEKT